MGELLYGASLLPSNLAPRMGTVIAALKLSAKGKAAQQALLAHLG